jgi:hypothetical protein
MSARLAESLPSPRRVGAWLGDMTDGELEVVFASSPNLAQRLRVQLDAYSIRAGTEHLPWSRVAILTLRPMVERMPEVEGPTGRAHVASMLDRVEADITMSHGKLCRWLGWIQCALTAHGVADLDTMKQHNLAACSSRRT